MAPDGVLDSGDVYDFHCCEVSSARRVAELPGSRWKPLLAMFKNVRSIAAAVLDERETARSRRERVWERIRVEKGARADRTRYGRESWWVDECCRRLETEAGWKGSGGDGGGGDYGAFEVWRVDVHIVDTFHIPYFSLFRDWLGGTFERVCVLRSGRGIAGLTGVG